MSDACVGITVFSTIVRVGIVYSITVTYKEIVQLIKCMCSTFNVSTAISLTFKTLLKVPIAAGLAVKATNIML